MSEHALNMSADRHPLTAALLSVIPGLGQLYVGDRRKGVLFLDVSILNFLLLWAILFTEPMVKSLQSFGDTFHVRPNESVVMALQHAHLGSPASVMILSMMVAFAVFAARDAYDRAFVKRRAIYPNSIVELSEATSGSYIIHISLMIAFGVLALFFLAPPPPKADIRTIEFVQPFEEEPKPVVKTDLKSAVNMRDHGRRDLTRPVNRSSAEDQASSPSTPPSIEKQAQAEIQSQTQSSAAAPAPIRPPQIRPRELPTPDISSPTPMNRSLDVKPSHPALTAPKLPIPSLPTPPVPQQSRARSTLSNLPTNLGPLANLSQTNIVTPVVASAAGIPAGFPGVVSPDSTMAVVTGKGPVPALPVSSAGGSGLSHDMTAPVKMASSTGGSAQGHAPDVVPVTSGNGPKNGTNGQGTGGPIPTRAPSAGSVIGDSVKVIPRGRESGFPSDAEGTGSTGTGSDTNPKKDTDDKRGREATIAMPDFGAYMADLQKRIKRQWFPPRGASSKRVVVIFTVHRDGHMTDLQRDTNSGDAIDLQAAMTAVQNAAPFPPLPKNSPSSVDIQFTFDYNVLVDGAPRRF